MTFSIMKSPSFLSRRDPVIDIIRPSSLGVKAPVGISTVVSESITRLLPVSMGNGLLEIGPLLVNIVLSWTEFKPSKKTKVSFN